MSYLDIIEKINNNISINKNDILVLEKNERNLLTKFIIMNNHVEIFNKFESILLNDINNNFYGELLVISMNNYLIDSNYNINIIDNLLKYSVDKIDSNNFYNVLCKLFYNKSFIENNRLLVDKIFDSHIIIHINENILYRLSYIADRDIEEITEKFINIVKNRLNSNINDKLKFQYIKSLKNIKIHIDNLQDFDINNI